MSLRESIQIALLLAVGTLLHLIIPGYGGGMKPDLLLGMFFIVLLQHRNLKASLLATLMAAVLSALTTTFPGGQIANLLDKAVTGAILYFLIKIFYERIPNQVLIIGVAVLGTMISGGVFLGTASLVMGLPAPFAVLFTTVVIPATILNGIAVVILYPVIAYSKRVVGGYRKV